MTTHLFDPDQACYSVNEVLKILSISRTSLYLLVKRNELVPLKMGRKTLFAATDIVALLAKLRSEAQEKRGRKAA